jgi:GPH family glycoside/pentoside/hexuronide:cation symporter
MSVIEDLPVIPLQRSEPAATTSKGIGWGTRAGVALAGMGDATAAQVVVLLALRYMTDSLAMAAAAAGAIFALTKFYDAFLDPAVGLLSDNFQSPWGRRLPFLAAGAVLLPISVALLFNIPHLPPAATVVVAALALMLFGAAESVFRVPFYAISVEVSPDYHERSSIMAIRVAGGSIGQLVGSSLPSLLLFHWGRGAVGNSRMSFIVAGTVFAMLSCAAVLLRNVRATKAVKSDHRVIDQLKTAWRNGPFRILALTHVCFLFGVATVSASNAYFSRDVLHRTDAWLALFYFPLIGGCLISIPVWVAAAKRWDKKLCCQLSLAFYGMMHFTWLLSGPRESLPMLLTQVFIIGLATGGVMVLTQSMLTDAIRYDFVKTGLRREGAFSGAMSLIDKAAGAAGIACMGWILASVGYVSSSTGGNEIKSASVLTGIYMNFSIIPAVTALGSILLLMGYKLKQADLKDDVN